MKIEISQQHYDSLFEWASAHQFDDEHISLLFNILAFKKAQEACRVAYSKWNDNKADFDLKKAYIDTTKQRDKFAALIK